MTVVALAVLLVLEVVLRVLLEVHEAKLFGKAHPLAALRCIPVVNDFVPFPENRLEPSNSKFVEMHELAHKEKHHALLRNFSKAVFYVLMVMMIVVQLATLRMTIVEIVLWFHVASVLFRLYYHWICFNQEDEADSFAAQKVGKGEARKELSRLKKEERATSNLFAFVYREHPDAARRRARFQ